jgi:hypothetical protein
MGSPSETGKSGSCRRDEEEERFYSEKLKKDLEVERPRSRPLRISEAGRRPKNRTHTNEELYG